MRALAAQEGHRIRGYKDEEAVCIGTGVFTAEAYDLYRQLKDDSREARYEMKPFSRSDFEDLQVNFFQPFRAFIMTRLRI